MPVREPRRDEAATTKVRSESGPSAPWLGVVAPLTALASFGWWLLYTWNVVGGLNRLGVWNYVGCVALIAATAVLMRSWRGG